MTDGISIGHSELQQKSGRGLASREDAKSTQLGPEPRERIGFMADTRSAGLEGWQAAERTDQCPARENRMGLLLPCTDGKYRPVESAPVGLADGVSDSLGLVRDADTGEAFFHPLLEKGKTRQRVMRLKGYGNAIHPEVAAEFIRAYLEAGK